MDERVKRLLSGGALVIDVGCGDGAPLDEVGPLYQTALGIDIATDRYARRCDERKTWTFMLGDLNRGFPVVSDVADVVHANQVIEHVANPLCFAIEARRVLRPGGLLIVTTPNIRYLPHVWSLVARGHGPITSAERSQTTEDWDSGHIHFFTPSDLAWIVREAGFTKFRTSALIAQAGRFQPLRRSFDRRAATPLVKNFFSGNTLLVAVK